MLPARRTIVSPLNRQSSLYAADKAGELANGGPKNPQHPNSRRSYGYCCVALGG